MTHSRFPLLASPVTSNDILLNAVRDSEVHGK
jgi:hypothetical protein